LGEQGRRDFKPKRVRGAEVDHQLVLGRQLDRQVGGLGALEDAAGINSDLMVTIREIGSVTHQPAGFDQMTVVIGRRNPVARCKGGKLHGAGVEESVGTDEQRVGVLAREGGKGRIDLADS
jgi:hypothetical protein